MRTALEAHGRLAAAVQDEPLVFDHLGSAQLRAGHLHGALASFDAALQLALDAPGPLYGRAGALARLGRRDAALTALERAVANGFAPHEPLDTHEAFRSCRDDPRFQALVRRLRTR